MYTNLLEELNACSKRSYPLHMPGHKRRLDPAGGALPYGIDITEIAGMDDLHHAEGILAAAEERTAALYGAGATRYLVNGSTVGILSAIRAVVDRNGEIIAARNSHKSVFHAIELMNLKAHYMMPEVLPEYDIFGSIRPEQVAAAIRENSNAGAVILTSPTYEGIVSDIASIADVCHDAGIPLIVDEAHGAHLIERFRTFWPAGAVAGGADLVIQSAHKTLPSLTQTAWLHINGKLVDPARLDHELDVFETSSPSYPLMASLDACTELLREHGEELFGNWEKNLRKFGEKTKNLKNLMICDADLVYAADPGKILVNVRKAGITGPALAEILRERYGFETEMAVGYNVLAMTSPADDPDALMRFADALLEIDRTLKEAGKCGEDAAYRDNAAGNNCAEADSDRRDVGAGAALLLPPAAEQVMTIADAMETACEQIPLAEAASHIAAEYIYAYPPGVPLIVPGERVTQALIAAIRELKTSGTEIYHMGRVRGAAEDGTILAVRI